MSKPRVEITEELYKRVKFLLLDGYSIRFAIKICSGSASERELKKLRQSYPDLEDIITANTKKSKLKRVL
jgi:hypothetical protein